MVLNAGNSGHEIGIILTKVVNLCTIINPVSGYAKLFLKHLLRVSFLADFVHFLQ